jgi:hypothetical protein
MTTDDEFKVNWWKVIGVTLLSITGVLVAWVIFASAIWGFGVATAGIYGRGEARKIIQSAEFRIPAYNHFFDSCAAIQGLEAGIDAQLAELPQAETTKDRSRIQANIAGLTAQRQRSIAQYNADARKDYTVGQFRDSGLPYQLEASPYPEGSKTSCGAH